MAKNSPAVQETNPQMLRLRQLFAEARVTDGDDPETAQANMVERIFKGETLDDILGGSDAVHAEENIGRLFHFTDVDFRDSAEQYRDKPGSINVFAVCHVTDPTTGEKLVVTTGSVQACAALLAIKERGLFPFFGKFARAEKPTASGYYPIWIRLVKDKDLPVGMAAGDNEPL